MWPRFNSKSSSLFGNRPPCPGGNLAAETSAGLLPLSQHWTQAPWGQGVGSSLKGPREPTSVLKWCRYKSGQVLFWAARVRPGSVPSCLLAGGSGPPALGSSFSGARCHSQPRCDQALVHRRLGGSHRLVFRRGIQLIFLSCRSRRGRLTGAIEGFMLLAATPGGGPVALGAPAGQALQGGVPASQQRGLEA